MRARRAAAGLRVRVRVRVRVRTSFRVRVRVRTIFERRSGDRTRVDGVCDFEKVPPDLGLGLGLGSGLGLEGQASFSRTTF